MDDRAARETFVRESYAGLFGWFCRLSGSPDLAADLTQETFAAFWASAGRIRAEVSPRTWLYAIGRNLWRKERRRAKARPTSPLGVVADAGRTAEERAEDREFREAAERSVLALPDDLREAFSLRVWHGFGYDEIGAIQGVTADLARWRYFAARRRLHRTLAPWDPERERGREDQYAR